MTILYRLCRSRVRCFIQTPVLLLLDNHESHLSIEAIDYAKNNGIVMLSFPPHCSYKLQPLDHTVYGPFKRYYNTALKDFMINNTAHRPDIYDIPGLVAKAYKSAMTIENITSGLKVTGIWPHNSYIFAEEEFLPSKDSAYKPSESSNPQLNNTIETCKNVLAIIFKPEDIRPFPVAPPRKLKDNNGHSKRNKLQAKCVLLDE
ncbi:hypothetical protein HELRODRAFT_158327 [Helobdella robusta]|uniref:DDE-1 domain-containing protein n=1 Tax=Helobdella robusta TaxID=6412 RepID=T1EMN7_HELRO|nr:hypothetical protein HELRODRAFT_158327 [Helobdella robusta]ESO11963.1 hypothetical protein HELRODRAFT_158327 [Helobdella robusta]